MEKVFLSILAGPAEPGLLHVVYTTLNYIYYMHFESHTLDTLQRLYAHWVAFHKNLQYFVNMGMWIDPDKFNILQLHS